MAIGKASDFKVYQDQLQAGIVETLVQNSTAFNEASGGAIRLSTNSLRGDYAYEGFFLNTAGLVARRDTTSTADIDDLALTQEEFISVKLNRRIGPVAQTRDAFKKIMAGRTEQEMSFILGQQAAKAMQVEMLNSALRGTRAALNNQANVKHTISSNGSLDTAGLVSGLAKLGDAADRIVTWVMHSKPYYDLVQSQITANIDGVSNFNVASASPVTLNRPVLVTDSEALRNEVSTGVYDYYILGLVGGATGVENSEEEDLVVEDVTGKENLIVRYQGEYAFNLGVKGFRWNTGSGANPNDTALGTGSNWVSAVTSYKDFAGVIIQARGA